HARTTGCGASLQVHPCVPGARRIRHRRQTTLGYQSDSIGRAKACMLSLLQRFKEAMDRHCSKLLVMAMTQRFECSPLSVR
ncbi:hypothetical protein, partial [Pseudomonas sp. SIMBA_044]|uniref:hypothetical protein n=1 Tax=Pseudomonas sp. SIMBA_044 TaxID=3085785 RepID=UPI00397A6E23